MKPRFITRMEEAFAVRQHVILSLNTEDRFYWPEENIGPSNLNYFVATCFFRQGYRIAQYVPSLGVREMNATGVSKECSPAAQNDPIAALNQISAMLRDLQNKWIVIIFHAERIASGAEAGFSRTPESMQFAEILHTLSLDDGIASGASRLVMVTFSGSPEDLIVRSRGFSTVQVDLPSQKERLSFIEFIQTLSDKGNCEFGQLERGMAAEDLARVTAGMPLFAIEKLFRSAAHFSLPISQANIRLLKADTLRNMARDLLEVSEPQEGFEGVAGLKSIKGYFMELMPQIRSGRPGVPQAFLFQGVPGGGKSHLVKALSKELGWPLIELRNVRNPYVGQSEMNLEHVIRVIEQLQPAILFFDEIDQLLGQRGTGVSGDSGTSERMLARIFTWLGSLHLRGKLLFVGATNRPDILDPALLDRFGVCIPFLKPSTAEIQEMAALLLKRFERTYDENLFMNNDSLWSSCSPTGREVQEILIDAGLKADSESGYLGTPVHKKHLMKAMENHIAREDDLEMEFISLVSLSLCSHHSLLPWNTSSGLAQNSVIPENLIESDVVDKSGRLNKRNLYERISEIKLLRKSERAMR